MHTNPDIYGIPDCWEKESSSSSLKELLQEANDLEPWLLPSFKLEDKRELPSDKRGVYFAHTNKVILYVGKTESSTGFNGRWLNHQTFETLQCYQQASKHPVRIAYWHILESQFIGQIESHLIKIWQPLLNKAGVSKELREIVNRYQEPSSYESGKQRTSDSNLDLLNQALNHWFDQHDSQNPSERNETPNQEGVSV